jgi:hypothetical protein
MSSLTKKPETAIEESPEHEPEPKGPNLILLYTLLALALIFAILFAAWIIRPFYLRR